MSRRVRFLVGVFAGAVVAMCVPGLASAHATLETSSPSANSVIEVSPTSIDLHFDEEINAKLASIHLFDGSGHPVVIDPVRSGTDQQSITAGVPVLAHGLYAVVWKATSVDGHVVDGAFSFQIGTGAVSGSAQGLIDQVLTGPAVDGALTWSYSIARFLTMIGVVLAVGTLGWSLLGVDPLHRMARFASLRRLGAPLLLVGALAAFVFFSAQIDGGRVGDGFSASAWRLALQTDTGRMLLLRVIAAAGLLVVVLRWQQITRRWLQLVLLVSSVAVLVSFSASGHPNSLSPRLWWIGVDLVHLASIVVWLGGLIAMWFAPKEWLAEPEAVRPVHLFSFAASVCVPLMVGTGVLQTWKLAGGLSDVTATTWGRMLLAKVMLVVAMVALGAVSRWLLQHEGAEHMRRTVMVETVIGVLVLALAAGIVSQAPRPSLPSKTYQEQLTANGVIASVTISPGHVGANEVHILVTPPGGSISPVASVTARVLLPSASIPAAPVTLTAEGPNHYSGSVTFPRAGDWSLEIIVGVTSSDNVQVKGTVSIP